jgi:hypothetical protein
LTRRRRLAHGNIHFRRGCCLGFVFASTPSPLPHCPRPAYEAERNEFAPKLSCVAAAFDPTAVEMIVVWREAAKPPRFAPERGSSGSQPVNRHAKGTPYRRAKGTPFVADCMKPRCFFVRLTGPFLRPGLITPRRRALPRSSMAAGHRRSRRAACLTAASTAPASSKGGSSGSAAVSKCQLSLPISTNPPSAWGFGLSVTQSRPKPRGGTIASSSLRSSSLIARNASPVAVS